MKSANAVLEGVIGAQVEKVFPLCCPVAEYEWIDGWKCELVHCPKHPSWLRSLSARHFTSELLHAATR